MTQYILQEVLASPSDLRRIMRAYAMLDAIIERHWEFRYFSFNSCWGNGDEMASMRNGEGDGVFSLFSPDGIFVKGFDHAYQGATKKAVSEMLAAVPKRFAHAIKEAAFDMDSSTFCMWNLAGSTSWGLSFVSGTCQDAHHWLLAQYSTDPQVFRRFATSYHDVKLPDTLIARFLSLEPIDDNVLREFPIQRKMSEIWDDVKEIGYPSRL